MKTETEYWVSIQPVDREGNKVYAGNVDEIISVLLTGFSEYERYGYEWAKKAHDEHVAPNVKQPDGVGFRQFSYEEYGYVNYALDDTDTERMVMLMYGPSEEAVVEYIKMLIKATKNIFLPQKKYKPDPETWEWVGVGDVKIKVKTIVTEEKEINV